MIIDLEDERSQRDYELRKLEAAVRVLETIRGDLDDIGEKLRRTAAEFIQSSLCQVCEIESES